MSSRTQQTWSLSLASGAQFPANDSLYLVWLYVTAHPTKHHPAIVQHFLLYFDPDCHHCHQSEETVSLSAYTADVLKFFRSLKRTIKTEWTMKVCG